MSNLAICSRLGCHKSVSTGMACDLCHSWYHPNCAGLTKDRYDTIETRDLQFHCSICVHKKMLDPQSVNQKDAITHTADEVVNHPHPPLEQSLIQSVERVLFEFAYSVTERLTEVSKQQSEIAIQISKLGAVLPHYTTAEQTNRLSSQEVLRTSLSLRDHMIRERRIILWGTFPKGTDPCTTAREVISSACGSAVGSSSLGPWLRAKRSKAKKGTLVTLSSCDHAAEVLSKRSIILGKHSNVRNLSLDKPIAQRLKKPSVPPALPPSDKLLSSTKVILTPLNLSQTVQSPASPMSPTVEGVEADRGELSDPGSRASSDAEALEMEPAVRSSIPISQRIV